MNRSTREALEAFSKTKKSQVNVQVEKTLYMV